MKVARWTRALRADSLFQVTKMKSESNRPEKPHPDRELAELLAAWANEEITEEEGERLKHRLRTEPDARQAYRRAVEFEALMDEEFPPVGQVPLITNFPSKAPRFGWWLAAAAALTFGAVAIFNSTDRRLFQPEDITSIPFEDDIAPPDEDLDPAAETEDLYMKNGALPVARVTAVHNAIVAKNSQPVALGSILKAGGSSSAVVLESGQLEITFFSGAKVLLGGPARFLPKSDFLAFLDYGSLTADVPSQATGFSINTPSTNVRDLGTAFALAVEKNGASSFRVIEGEIEAGPSGAPEMKRFLQNEGARVENGKMVLSPTEAVMNPMQLPSREISELPKGVHWTFDKTKKGAFLDEGNGNPISIRGTKDRRYSNSPHTVNGVFGKALHFDGGNRIAVSPYRGVEGNNARSVAFWIKLPPVGNLEAPNGIVSWGENKPASKWQIAWNAGGEQGALGALRVEFGDGYAIGSKDLCDGRWHHVAVVYLGGARAKVSTHVKIFIDGRLDMQSGRSEQLIRTSAKTPGAAPVTIGRYIGPWKDARHFYLTADIDELRIFDTALTPAQIAGLAEVPDA